MRLSRGQKPCIYAGLRTGRKPKIVTSDCPKLSRCSYPNSQGTGYTLKPIDCPDFCRTIALPKTGSKSKKKLPPFPSAPFYGKTGSALLVLFVSLCGPSPAPRPPPKSRKGERRCQWDCGIADERSVGAYAAKVH